MIVVLTTVESAEDAEILAEKIVAARLAACVQILPGMRSIYVWKGETAKAEENLLLIKTLEDKFAPLRKFIEANHSYYVPEIIALRAEDVSLPYMKWLSVSLDV